MTFQISPLEDADIDAVCGGVADAQAWIGKLMIEQSAAQRAAASPDRIAAVALAKNQLMSQSTSLDRSASKMIAAVNMPSISVTAPVSALGLMGGGKDPSRLKGASA